LNDEKTEFNCSVFAYWIRIGSWSVSRSGKCSKTRANLR